MHAQPSQQYDLHHHASAFGRCARQGWLHGATSALVPDYEQQLDRASQPTNLLLLDCYQQFSLQDGLASLALDLCFILDFRKAVDIQHSSPASCAAGLLEGG